MIAGSDRRRVLCIGESLIDLIVDGAHDLATGDRFAIREGGAPMNVAVALARLGVPAGFVGVVGDDPFGARLAALLAGRGVDAHGLRRTPHAATSIAYAWRDERGDGQFQLLRMADILLSPADIDAAGIAHASAIVVGSVALAASPSREAIIHAVDLARRHDVPVVVDVNVRRMLWASRDELLAACEPLLARANVLKMSMDDVEHLWGVRDPALAFDVLEGVSDALSVLTDGDRSVSTRDRSSGRIVQLPVFRVQAVDPTGAGDAFTAALISRLLASRWSTPTRDDLMFAMAAGALTTTTRGALASLPTHDDVERFLAAHTSPA